MTKPIEVLLVEDGAGDALLTGQILAEFPRPVKLTLARDGPQALSMLAEPSFKPDMIILDLNLPTLSGFTVMERNKRKEIPVIVFSATRFGPDVERALCLGAREYVQKPMDMQAYRNAVLGMIRNWAVPQEQTKSTVTADAGTLGETEEEAGS